VPHFRLGGQIKFTQEALQEWVNQHMTAAEGSNEPGMGPVDGRRGRRSAVGVKASHANKLSA
jgi:hypothetical protein